MRRLSDDFLHVSSLKAMLDGSLGTHTAAFIEPYDDTPEFRGHLIWDEASLERLVTLCSENSMQVQVNIKS